MSAADLVYFWASARSTNGVTLSHDAVPAAQMVVIGKRSETQSYTVVSAFRAVPDHELPQWVVPRRRCAKGRTIAGIPQDSVRYHCKPRSKRFTTLARHLPDADRVE